MSKSFKRIFLESMVIALAVAAILIPIGIFVGKRPLEDLLFVWMFAALLLGGSATIIRYLMTVARQRREVCLPCDFEEACALCLASLDLFPSYREHEFLPGSYTFMVINNPGVFATVAPEKFGWVDWVILKVVPKDDSETLITIETLADLNRAASVILDRQRHNADRIVEFFEARYQEQ
jgi:hypothetical protein